MRVLTVPHVTVRDIVEIPALGLVVRAGHEHLDNVIDGAHVSEVLRAVDLLEGGEFLLTTGALLGDHESDWESYVGALTRQGAAGLALGVGPELRHRTTPEALIASAQTHGLPLVEIPAATSFLAVTKAIFAARTQRDRQTFEASMELQRELTKVAARERGLSGLVTAWKRATGEEAFVLDRRARLLSSTVTVPAEVVMQVADAANRLKPLSTGSHRVPTELGEVRLMTVGATRHAGYLARLGSSDAPADLAVSALLSLLALEFERRWLLDEPQRRARANHLARLLSVEDETKVFGQLKVLGVDAREVRAIVIQSPTEEHAEEVLADLTITLGTPFARRRGSVVEAIALSDPRPALEHFGFDVPIGIGTSVGPWLAARSMRQAHSALATSRRTRTPVEYVDGAAHRFLLAVADPDYLQSFADAVLAPLDAADNADALLGTLHAWFAEERSVAGCSERLGIHRHTVRHRMQRITELLGRSPETVDAQTELWLALKARGIDQDGGPIGPPS